MFRFPDTTVWLVCTCGETDAITDSRDSASASRRVKRGEVSRVPGPNCRPGRIDSTLLPRLATFAATCADEP